MLVTPNSDLASGALGLLWAILSGLLFALLLLASRSNSGQVGPVQAALWQNTGVALCLLPFAVGELPALPALDWLWPALLGVFCTGLAHSLFVASLAVVKARTAALVFARSRSTGSPSPGCSMRHRAADVPRRRPDRPRHRAVGATRRQEPAGPGQRLVR